MSDELGKSLQHSINQKFGRGTYRVLEPIKRGADGYVYKIEFIKEKRLGALKVLPKSLLTTQLDSEVEHKNKYRHDSNLERKAENEIKIHSSIHSSYVVQLQTWSKDDMNYYLVMQYISKGDLGDEIKKNPHGLPFNRVRKIGLQLAKAIDTIHKKCIVHRDIKPQNVLLTEQDEIKLCDFSCATQLKKNQKLSGAIGTLEYMAPQILSKYDHSIDIWSYGCILYVLVMGHVPFKLLKYEISEYVKKINKVGVTELKKNLLSTVKINSQQYMKQINDQECKQDSKKHEECCQKLVNLLKKIFQIDVAERITMNSIIKHPFFTGEKLVEELQQQEKKIPSIQETNQQHQPSISINIKNQTKNSHINFNNRSNQNMIGFIKTSLSYTINRQQKQVDKIHSKPSYSLQNMKKYKCNNQNPCKTAQEHLNEEINRNSLQNEKKKKKNSQMVQKYKQRNNVQYNTNINVQTNRRNNSNASQTTSKQTKQNTNINVYNNQNINTLNHQQKNRCGKIINTKSSINYKAEELIKYKLIDNYDTANDNKYISDGTHNTINTTGIMNIPNNYSTNQNSTHSIGQPLNCEGINYQVQYNEREFITINENGLKGEFYDSGKIMMISPKGGHVKIVYGEKSKEYCLDKLPEKYSKLYNFYKGIVEEVKIQFAKENEKKKKKCGKNYDKQNNERFDGETRICRTSRQKQIRNNENRKMGKFNDELNKDSLQSIEQRQCKKQPSRQYKQRPTSQQHYVHHNDYSHKYSSYNISTSIDIQLNLSYISASKQKQQQSFTLRLTKYQSSSHQIKVYLLNAPNLLQLSLTVTKFHKQHIANTLLELLASYKNIQRNKQQYKQNMLQQNREQITQYVKIIKEYCYWLHTMPCFQINKCDNNRNKGNRNSGNYNKEKYNIANDHKVNRHHNNSSQINIAKVTGNSSNINKILNNNHSNKYPLHTLLNNQRKQQQKNKERYYDHKKLLQKQY